MGGSGGLLAPVLFGRAPSSLARKKRQWRRPPSDGAARRLRRPRRRPERSWRCSSCSRCCWRGRTPWRRRASTGCPRAPCSRTRGRPRSTKACCRTFEAHKGKAAGGPPTLTPFHPCVVASGYARRDKLAENPHVQHVVHWADTALVELIEAQIVPTGTTVASATTSDVRSPAAHGAARTCDRHSRGTPAALCLTATRPGPRQQGRGRRVRRADPQRAQLQASRAH